MSDALEQAIRRRLYERQRAVGKVDASLAAHFVPCSSCGGRGQICHKWLDDGIPTASLDPCDTCNGDGFIDRPAPAAT